MKRTRHQFAPAMPGQKVIDRAVAGSVPDGLLIGRLEIVDVQHLSGPGGLGEARQQGLLLGHRHVLALASAARLGLERLDPAVVIGHVRPVHRAQRDTHGRCNRRLRHPALAQQYHLHALTLHGGNFPAQRCLQLPDLGLATFDHLFPLRIRWSERITPCSSKTIPFSRIRNQHKNRRFNQLWKRYKLGLSRRTFVQGSVGLTVANFVPGTTPLAFAATMEEQTVAAAKTVGKADVSGMIWSPYFVPMQPVIAEFTKQTGIGIGGIQDISIFDAPQRAMAEALSRSPQFDFIHIDSNMIPSLVSAGYLEPLDEYI